MIVKNINNKSIIARRQSLWGFLFISPNLILFIIFFLIPIFATVFFSFAKWDLVNPAKYIGIGNYKELLRDREFYKVFINTLYFTIISTPLNVILPLFLAMALNQKIKGIAIYRTAYFLPVVSSMVAVSLVWLWLFNRDYGLINAFLKLIGFSKQGWLNDVRLAMPSVVIVTVWKGLGFYMTIFLAALQDVPDTLIEAAKIDGANWFQRFFHITIPMISPAIFFVVIMSTIWGFQTFDQIYMITEGGPLGSTTVLVYELYKQGFEFLRMGKASAIAIFLLAIILVGTLIQWQIRKRWVYGEF